ncbi:MAG: hypothetical protein WD894_05630 [Pirellulales bacterium]
MGIHLQCPNGHKVHVKSFLAGKRGLCPQCGAKFDIPTDPKLSSDGGGDDEISVAPSRPGEAGLATELGIAATPRDDADRMRAAKRLPSDPLDPATLDLDAMAAAGGSRLLGAQAFGSAGQRLASRRKSAQTMRTLTLVLTVVVTLLACVLLYIVFRSR